LSIPNHGTSVCCSESSVGARLAAVGKQLDLCPKAEMREIRTSGLKSGIWKRRHGQIFRHRHPERVGKQFMAAPNPTAPDLDLQLKSRHSCSSSSFLLENLAVWSNEPTAQNNCERVSLLSRRKSWVFEDDHEDEDENDFQTCLNFGFRVKPPPARAGAEP
jgi:hypothetical protein